MRDKFPSNVKWQNPRTYLLISWERLNNVDMHYDWLHPLAKSHQQSKFNRVCHSNGYRIDHLLRAGRFYFNENVTTLVPFVRVTWRGEGLPPAKFFWYRSNSTVLNRCVQCTGFISQPVSLTVWKWLLYGWVVTDKGNDFSTYTTRHNKMTNRPGLFLSVEFRFKCILKIANRENREHFSSLRNNTFSTRQFKCNDGHFAPKTLSFN